MSGIYSCFCFKHLIFSVKIDFNSVFICCGIFTEMCRCKIEHMETKLPINTHPCFNAEAKKTHARVHLPVAPKCNIQCNYCNRKYDCVQESRPGVTSSVLTPEQARAYFSVITQTIEDVSVVGIAGPGDPFATPELTIETLRLIREDNPHILFCVSTNGANLYNYIDDIAALGVTHVTITINGLETEVLQEVYSWARINKHVYRGLQASEKLLEEQLRCIPKLKEHGIVVKINTIYIPGINDTQIEPLAKKVKELGADTMNCIPLCPVEGTKFESFTEPDEAAMKPIFAAIETHIEPMKHCSRCRADAAGKLGKDNPVCHKLLKETAMQSARTSHAQSRVAVASYEGILVNQHLGEAASLYIFEQNEDGYRLVGERKTPAAGTGDNRWVELAELLCDCRALLTGGVGPKPTIILEKKGIQVVQMCGLITSGLDAIYMGLDISKLAKTEFKCGSSCKGNAQGCA